MKVLPNQSRNIIENWESDEDTHEYNKVLKTSEDFIGLSHKRNCTDIFCLIIFIVFNSGLIGLSYYIYLIGNIDRLGHGSDFRGDVCGVNDLSHREFKYYPDPNNVLISLCLESCPNKIKPESICYYDTDKKTIIKAYVCWDSIETTEFGYYCLPKGEKDRKIIIDEFFTNENLIRRAGGDLITVWEVGTLGILISFLISCGLLLSLPFPAKLRNFTIFSIIFNSILFPCIPLLVFRNSQEIRTILCKENNSVTPDYCYTTPEFGLWILTGISGFFVISYVVFTICYRKRIKKLMEVYNLTTEPIFKVKRIVLIPVAFIFLGILTMGGLYVLMLYSFGIGNVVKYNENDVPGGKVNKLEFRNSDRLVLGYIIFMCIWWLGFMVAVCEFIVAGVVAAWHFTKEKSTIYHPISTSLKYCFRYHLGSIIRGSFYNLFLKPPQYLLHPLNSYLFRNKTSKFSNFLACLFYPFLSLHNHFFKYPSSSAYIILSIFGKSYSISSRQSYYLKKRNQKRTKDVLTTAWIGMIHMKFTIILPGFISVYSFLLLNDISLFGYSTQNLTSFLAPAVFSVIFCVFIAQVVCSSFYSTAEAVALCVAADEEMFTADQRFVKDEVQEVFDNSYSETRKADFIGIETQRPGRSDRMPVNLIEFDRSFNAKVSPIPMKSGNKSYLQVSDFQ